MLLIHRVALDWLFDRINLDPKIQIRYVGTKHQIADILTKGHFIRDEWNDLLCLFNISHFNFLCCAKKSSLINCNTERINQRSSVVSSSSSVNSPTASRSLGILKASSRQVGLSGRHDATANQNSNPDAASSSQGWQRDAQLFYSTGKPVALVTTEHQVCSGNPKFQKIQEIQNQKSNLATSFPYITRLCASHGESSRS